MSGISDTATVTLNVNGAQAKQFMAELEKKIKDTEAAINDMKKNMADPKEIEKAKKQLKTYKKQLDEMISATEGVNRALTNLELATPRELEKALKTLNRQLKDMTPGSEVWDSHIEKIREVKARLSDIRNELGRQQTLWDKFKTWANDIWPVIDLGVRGYDAIISAMREIVDAYADMEQEMANVRKFTGMTTEQVEELNEEFKKMDTRTSREELNKLAQEAGRLGKSSKEDVLEFVRAADVINVALDDLGDGATLTLSKLTGIFGDEQMYGTEQSLLKVGSVINELSQSCSASAPYIANFTERMGGVGAQAGLTIPQIMAFGSVLDVNAQKVEASATALSQIIVRLYQDPAKYAKVAGLDAQEFASLMREDANAALILFLETLQKAGGMDKLSPMFKDMGENGARAISALSTLATHIDMVKEQQNLANTAFNEGTSVLNEFNVQNNTVQGGLDKAKKAANELMVELGSLLAPLMSHFLTTSSMIKRALLTTIQFLIENKEAVLSLAAGIAAYTIVVNAAIIKEKILLALNIAQKAAMVAWTAAVKLGSVAVALFSGNIAKAKAAWIAFSVAIRANPLGLAIAAVTALVGLVVAFASNASKATTEAERLANAKKKIAEAGKEAEANCAAELKTLEALYKASQNQNLAMEDRRRAVARLQEQYPEYFGNLSQEAILAGNAADAYERLRINIIRSARAEAYRSLMVENEREILKKKRDRDRNVHDSLSRLNIPESESGIVPYVDELAAARAYVERESWLYRNLRGDDGYIKYAEIIAEEANREIAELERENELLSAAVANNTLDGVGNSAGGNRSGNVGSSGDNSGGSGHDGSGSSTPKPDRFAVEKAAREQAEAAAKISYYRGESDYEEYTSRMNEIAIKYFSDLLERTDLSAQERLSIEAQYWEEVNKKTVAANQKLIEEENESYERTLFNINESLREKLEAGNLSAEERENAERIHREAVELEELRHLSNLVSLYKEGSAERLRAEEEYQRARIEALKRHQREYEAEQARLRKEEDDEEARLAKFKATYFGDNLQERQEKYESALGTLSIVYDRELAMAGENADEKLRIEEAYLKAQLELRRQYGFLEEEDTRNSMQRAVDASVEWLNGSGGKALTESISTLTSGMSSIFSGLSTMMQAELEIQTAQIESRYDKELKLAQGNSYKVAQLEKKKEAEIAKAKNDANKKMFAMQVIQAVAQTAQNAISAYGSAAAIPIVGYILAPVAAAMAVAAGAIQIAAIKKQQQAAEAKGYSSGGFTRPGRVDEPAGIVHAGEWVASQKLLANPVARPMIEALDYAQRTNTIGSLRAEDVSRSVTAPATLVRASESNDGMLALLAAASRMSGAVDNLTDRLKEPFATVNTITGDHGIKSAQDEYARLIANKNPKSKRNAANYRW